MWQQQLLVQRLFSGTASPASVRYRSLLQDIASVFLTGRLRLLDRSLSRSSGGLTTSDGRNSLW